MSANRYPARVCSFQSAPDVTSRTTYGVLRAAVLKAGRFSVFEATATPRAARLFTQLCQDPTLETSDMGYPWTGVREKSGPPRALSTQPGGGGENET